MKFKMITPILLAIPCSLAPISCSTPQKKKLKVFTFDFSHFSIGDENSSQIKNKFSSLEENEEVKLVIVNFNTQNDIFNKYVKSQDAFKTLEQIYNTSYKGVLND